MTSVVTTTKGAIGYISASYIEAAGLQAAAVENAAGNFEYPNSPEHRECGGNGQARAGERRTAHRNPPKKAKIAYPISTFPYRIVPNGAPKKAELEQFIRYNLTTGQEYGAALDFAELPKVVLKAGERAVASL